MILLYEGCNQIINMLQKLLRNIAKTFSEMKKSIWSSKTSFSYNHTNMIIEATHTRTQLSLALNWYFCLLTKHHCKARAR